jgi:hypothetical protein
MNNDGRLALCTSAGVVVNRSRRTLEAASYDPRALARAESDQFAYDCGDVHVDEVRRADKASCKCSHFAGEFHGSYARDSSGARFATCGYARSWDRFCSLEMPFFMLSTSQQPRIEGEFFSSHRAFRSCFLNI